MQATQRVELSNRKWRTYPDVGLLRYTNSAPHHHWHFMRFDVFQLRTPDGRLVVSDRKSGFCLADHWGTAPGVWPGRKARFLGDCEQYHPEATRVVEGTSLGFTDRYPAFFHSMLDSGINLPPSVFEAWFVSAALDDAAVDRILDAAPAAAKAAAAATASVE